MNKPILIVAFASLLGASTGLIAQTQADNTKQNSNDQGTAAATPMDQSESKGDIKITADIRKAVMKEHGLSMDARNIKIITNAGNVTLRGVVKSEDEKAAIVKLAKAEPGVANLDTQISIK